MRLFSFILMPVFAVSIYTGTKNSAPGRFTKTPVPYSAPVKVVPNATDSFRVWGNCNTCRKKIEGAVRVKGVTSANWNMDTKMMVVSYDSTMITTDEMQKRIAAVGYDTENYHGDDKAYHKLDKCCQYERKPVEQ